MRISINLQKDIEMVKEFLNEFMAHMQEKYNVVIFIPQPEVPKLTILPK